MSVAFGVAPETKPGRPFAAAQIVRKIAIFGAHHGSLQDAPWSDQSWEKWGHASSRFAYKTEMDRYYDLHPKACWTRGGRKTAMYPRWLASNRVPIYMQKRWPEVPASLEFPKGRILQEFGEPRPYFTNHVAWMIAHALTEGVSTIGLFGVEYGIQSEYQIQRASCEYWLGRAAERGVRIVLPAQCTLLGQPKELYGYESHDEETGRRIAAYERKEWKTPEIVPVTPETPGTLMEVPEKLKEEIRLEEIEYPRPEGFLGPLGGNGKAQEA